MVFLENFHNYFELYKGSVFYTIVHSKPFNVIVSLVILYFLIKVIKIVLTKLTNALINVSDQEQHKKQ